MAFLCLGLCFLGFGMSDDGLNARDHLDGGRDQGVLSQASKGEIRVSLVPLGVVWGLALFSLVLALAGYGVRLWFFGEAWQEVVSQAVVVVPALVLGIPALFWVGALGLNWVAGTQVQRRNALGLGWLVSCVFMLWLMGVYS